MKNQAINTNQNQKLILQKKTIKKLSAANMVQIHGGQIIAKKPDNTSNTGIFF